MKKTILLVLVVFQVYNLRGQVSTVADSNYVILLNQQIDDYVVENKTAALEKLYADDFVFSHGSGKVEGRESWLKSVAKGSFLQRKHDSVTVEMHPGLAIVRGKLSVQKKATHKTDRYHLKYVRIYAYRSKQWQMISHFTFFEYHEPG